MSKESIQGPLSALRNAGTVSGVCLLRGTEVLVNMLPYSNRRVDELASVIDDLFYYFGVSRRDVDQFAFGFDSAGIVVVTEGEFRLLVVHLLEDEIDFIAKAARAFLVDFRLGLFAEELDARNAMGAVGGQAPAAASPAAAASPPAPLPAELPHGPTIRPLAPLSEKEEELEQREANGEGTRPGAGPSRKTTRVPRMIAEPPERSAPIPEPTLISWSARKKAGSPASPPASVPAPPSAVSPDPAQPGQAKAAAFRTHRAPAPGESESVAARHRAHLAPNQPESTLPPRRMPQR